MTSGRDVGGDARLVLDTSAYACFRRGEPQVTAMIRSASTLWVPSVVIGELRAGFLRGSRTAENGAVLDQFLHEPWVDVVPVDGTVASHYARIHTDLRRAGTPIPSNDIWIAACARGLGLPLLTFDRHYLCVTSVDVLFLEAS